MRVAALLFRCAAAGIRLSAPRMQTQWSTPSYQPKRDIKGISPELLCQALQSGAMPESLADVLGTPRTARAFFELYLTGAEWTCADADEVPSALTEAMELAPPPVQEVLLMNILSAAAASGELADRKGARARLLINSLWDSVTPLRLSCIALKDSVATKAGIREESVIEDASGGDMELVRSQWLGLLDFANYDAEQLARMVDALAPCGGSMGAAAADTLGGDV